MRVALLTRYTERVGSTRIRVLQFVPLLEQAGVRVRVLPWTASGSAALARYSLNAFRLARWADVVLIQKPCHPPWLINLLTRTNPRVVVDFDDAVWAATRDGTQARSAEYGDRLAYAISSARIVTAGSRYLARWAMHRSPGTAVEVLPSSIDVARYGSTTASRRNPVPTIGWIGNPGNYPDFAAPVLEVLRAIVDSGRARFKVVSSRPLEVDGLRAEFAPWSPEGEVEALHDLDIGIMPLLDTERSRGRCGFKAVQYQAVGIPVVASKVEGAVEVVDDSVTGFTVGTAREWAARLGALIDDPALRRTMGAGGRRRVEENYSLQATFPRLLDILERAGRADEPFARVGAAT